jgi:hypothetical protein
MKEKTKEYQVQAIIKTIVCISVSAKTLEEALDKSKALTEKDFITIDGEYMDGEYRITGVYESCP